jgi:hypothetical protein
MTGIKLQSAFEYAVEYSWAFIVLAIAIAAVAGYVALQQPASSPSYCYISPEIDCYQAAIATNASGSQITTVFTNMAGSPILINNYAVSLPQSSVFSTGNCNTTTLNPGESAACSVYISGYRPSTGASINLNMVIQYQTCGYSCANLVGIPSLNITGTATVRPSVVLGRVGPCHSVTSYLFNDSNTSSVSDSSWVADNLTVDLGAPTYNGATSLNIRVSSVGQGFAANATTCANATAFAQIGSKSQNDTEYACLPEQYAQADVSSTFSPSGNVSIIGSASGAGNGGYGEASTYATITYVPSVC